MSLYLKFLTTTLAVFSLMGATPSNEELGIDNNSAKNIVPSVIVSEEEANMAQFQQSLYDVMHDARKVGVKPFARRIRGAIDTLLSDKSIDYACGLYGSVCNTVPEWALWASAGFFVDSCTLGFFCDSHLGALAISSMLCYGSAKVSQLFGSNKAQDEVRSTLLSYCLDKMLGRNK